MSIVNCLSDLRKNFFIVFCSLLFSVLFFILNVQGENQDTLSIDNARIVAEGDSGVTVVTFNVYLRNQGDDDSFLDSTLSVDYQISGTTATAGSDFISSNGTLTFNDSVSLPDTLQISVAIIGDTLVELDEVFTIVLQNPSTLDTSAFIVPDSAAGIVTIMNDDGEANLTIADATINEDDNGITNLNFIVTLSNQTASEVSVNYIVADFNAVSGEDYINSSGSVVFSPIDTSETLTIQILGDSRREADDSFVVILQNAVNATISDDSATGTILNDDALPVLSVSDIRISEGNTGNNEAVFTVSLDRRNDSTVTFNYQTGDVTALGGTDYVSISSTADSIVSGSLSVEVRVAITGDINFESDETFELILSSIMNTSNNSDTGLATIVNDDGLVGINIEGASNDEANDLSFRVFLDGTSSDTVRVSYRTVNGTALSGSDYTSMTGTLVFLPDSIDTIFSIIVNDDTEDEVDELLNVELFDADTTTAVILDNSASGRIVDNDGAPSITISDNSVNEGNSGITNLGFTINLSNRSSSEVRVNYILSDFNAVSNEDYINSSGSVVFSPTDTSEILTIQILGDGRRDSVLKLPLTILSAVLLIET